MPVAGLVVPQARSWSFEWFFAFQASRRDAIDLLAGPQARLIRTCDEPDCRMLFVETSPEGRRGWCSMTRCGSKVKGKVFRENS
ncbi:MULTISPECIES: CGNR zinc finger domain-containing protein [Bradyrhizobium]|uniref:CGNR zinc finger domain-containing protein n=1 Tax=Bradyrhizobium elkanii TaxID=29448 RepID=UPI003D9B88BF